jgi:putative tryptophan/tyrosine transport system substrate-binding protein
MRRRDLIKEIAGALAAWPFAATAQPPAMPVIGFLCSGSAEAFGPEVAAFRDGLKETGYVEGRNVGIEFAWAAGRYDMLPSLAIGLVSRRVGVIAAVGGAVAGLAAKAATSTIPIVFVMGDDPVKYGLVASLSRPGSNITGVTLFIDILTAKRVELLTQVAPASALAILVNSRNPNAETEVKDAQTAARQSGRKLRVLTASNEGEIDAAFADLAQQLGVVLTIGTDTFFYSQRDQLVGLAARYAIPTIYFHRWFGLGGGLITYGATFTDEFRMAENMRAEFWAARSRTIYRSFSQTNLSW